MPCGCLHTFMAEHLVPNKLLFSGNVLLIHLDCSSVALIIIPLKVKGTSPYFYRSCYSPAAVSVNLLTRQLIRAFSDIEKAFSIFWFEP